MILRKSDARRRLLRAASQSVVVTILGFTACMFARNGSPFSASGLEANAEGCADTAVHEDGVVLMRTIFGFTRKSLSEFTGGH